MLIITTDRTTVGVLREAIDLGAALFFEVPAEAGTIDAELAKLPAGDVEALFIPSYTCDFCSVAITEDEAVIGFGGISCEPCQIEVGAEVEAVC